MPEACLASLLRPSENGARRHRQESGVFAQVRRLCPSNDTSYTSPSRLRTFSVPSTSITRPLLDAFPSCVSHPGGVALQARNALLEKERNPSEAYAYDNTLPER